MLSEKVITKILIGRGGHIWTARLLGSPDLKLIDFYQWGIVKVIVYSIKVKSQKKRQELKVERINDAFTELKQDKHEIGE